MQFRPTDIAKECSVSVGTVRNWCSDYATFLSAGANPAEGERRLNERDLEVCKYIAGLRKEGMSKPQISLRLSETSFGAIEPEKPIEQPSQKPVEALQSQQENLHTLAPLNPDVTTATPAVIVALDDLQTRLAILERSSTDARQNQRDYVVGLALGALGMGLLMILLLLLFLVRHYL